MTISLRYAALSSVGLVRSTNQDSAYAGPHLIAMCDGMGGPAGGDIASAVAISHLEPLDADSHQASEMLGLLRNAVHDAHMDLVSRSAAEPALTGLGTTCIAVMRSGNKLAMVHVGDSRAYLLRHGELTQVTTDHTFVEYLVATGRLTREQARQHPQRSVLLKTLGDAEGEVQLDESIREAVPGDRWLLCSDGLSGPVSADTITDVLRNYTDPAEAAKELVNLAERAGGPDNITAVIFDVVENDPTPQLEPQVVGSAAAHREQAGAQATSALPAVTIPSTPAAKAAALLAGMDNAAASPSAPTSPVSPLSPASPAGAVSPDLASAGAPAGPRSPWRLVRRIAAVLLILTVLTAGCIAAYRWTQTQYYVTISEGKVAIFRGISQDLGPLSFSHEVVSYDKPAVADLDERMRQRLEETVAQSSLDEAKKYVETTVAGRTTDRLEESQATPSATPTPNPVVTVPGDATPTPLGQ